MLRTVMTVCCLLAVCRFLRRRPPSSSSCPRYGALHNHNRSASQHCGGSQQREHKAAMLELQWYRDDCVVAQACTNAFTGVDRYVCIVTLTAPAGVSPTQTWLHCVEAHTLRSVPSDSDIVIGRSILILTLKRLTHQRLVLPCTRMPTTTATISACSAAA